MKDLGSKYVEALKKLEKVKGMEALKEDIKRKAKLEKDQKPIQK